MTNDLGSLDDVDSTGPGAAAATHGLRLVTKLCGSAACPTVYQSDRGTLVVQGYAVPAEVAGFELPEGELMVEIPVELLKQAAGLVS